MQDFIHILQCPQSGEPLLRTPDGDFAAVNGQTRYRVRNGVVNFLTEANAVHDFYEEEGWSQDEDGQFGDTKVFTDMRPTPLAFTQRCMRRIGTYFARGGHYILDAGSGPIAHPEMLDYSARFEKRVCVDLSARGLGAARAKLGDRGVYLQGDLTRLPLKDNSMDAVTCNHVLYQLPAESQPAAFRELWRVLRPGGIAVVVYWWPESQLAWRLEKVLKRLPRPRRVQEEQNAASRGPVRIPSHNPLSVEWFEAQRWPFAYTIESFRAVDNVFMRKYVGDDWVGKTFLSALYAFQQAFPVYSGRHGAMPAIIIRKTA